MSRWRPLAIAVCTFGAASWFERGRATANRTATDTWGSRVATVHHFHDETLAAARNRAADETNADWLCYLDADDELELGYAKAMAARIEAIPFNRALIQPATRFVAPEGTELPRLDSMGLIPPHPGGLTAGNHLIIGTAVPRQLVLDVGGWDDTLPVLEDWDLWIRCWRAGAALATCPGAIYIANITPDGRNLRLGPAERARWAQTIRRRYA